jgi:hypothetical protein
MIETSVRISVLWPEVELGTFRVRGIRVTIVRWCLPLLYSKHVVLGLSDCFMQACFIR